MIQARQSLDSGYLLRLGEVFGVVLLCLHVLTGCAFHKTVSGERYERALKLVDEGVGKMREGKFREAQVAFSMAEDLAPLAAAVDGQGCIALLSGELEKAERLFEQAHEMDGAYENALANLALLHEIKGDVVKARKLYDKAIEGLPDSIAARNNRAALEYDDGARKMEVVEELQKAGLLGEHHVVQDNLVRLGHPLVVPETGKKDASLRGINDGGATLQ